MEGATEAVQLALGDAAAAWAAQAAQAVMLEAAQVAGMVAAWVAARLVAAQGMAPRVEVEASTVISPTCTHCRYRRTCPRLRPGHPCSHGSSRWHLTQTGS